MGPSLDGATARRLLRQVEALLGQGAAALLLDLSAVEHIDSLGLATLVQIARAAPPGCRVVAAGLSPAVQTIARVTFLHEILELFLTVPEAERALDRAA